MLGQSKFYVISPRVFSIMLSAFVVAVGVASALTASAQVPTRVPFQGLLLDSAGTPVNDSVDLDFELFDGLVAGESLWSESHLGVIAVDGVYSVELGETVPLGEGVLGNGQVFLEITVGGEVLVPRQQLLSVPFALRAARAESVGTVGALLLEQVADQFPFDGQAPPNFHPDEGFADTDLDGRPNYLDPDNDNDGINDGVELANGTSINLISPRIDSVTPNAIESFAPVTLNVTGEFLDLVTAVTFGAETPTPIGLTPTGFSIDVTAETLATSLTVDLVASNGESGSSSPVPITKVAPTITDVLPIFASVDDPTDFTVTGTGFYPGTIVRIDGVSAVPTALTETSISVTLAPPTVGTRALEVVHPNTLVASTNYEVVPEGPKIAFVTSATMDGNLGGIAGANALCQSEATTAGLSGTFLAWLSTSDTAPVPSSPSTTFDQNSGPWISVLGVTIAQDWDDLTDGTLSSALSVTAAGDSVAGFVWTGTATDGTSQGVPTQTCNEWTTSSGATGAAGTALGVTSSWTQLVTGANCTSNSRLYCFEQ